MGVYAITLATLAAIEVILVLGLNLQYGFAGVLNFSYITFVALGAYTTGVTTLGPGLAEYSQRYILHWSLPWPAALAASGCVAAGFAVLLSFLVMQRLRSDYLAISMIAFGQVVWTVVGNYTPLVNGWDGLAGIPRPFMDLSDETSSDVAFLAVALGIAVLTYVVAARLYGSPLGRLLRAIREDATVAETFGRRAARGRLIAFVLGSFVAGVGGGLLAMESGAFGPNAFLPEETFLLFAALIVGGTASPVGSVIGGVLVLVLINEATRYVPGSLSGQLLGGLRLMLIGILVLVVLKFRSGGLVKEGNLRLYRRLVRRLGRRWERVAAPKGTVGVPSGDGQ